MADDIVAKLKELMYLPPEERLKRLREIEERNKKEIEEAHKLMQESEAELVEEEKEKEQLPIPQLKAVDFDTLVSEEERRIFATKRQVSARKKDDEDEKPKRAEKKLEETLGSEPTRLSPVELEAHRQYQTRLATAPIRDLYSMASQLIEEAKQLDPNRYQQQAQELVSKARDLQYAALYKGRDMQEGVYKGNERTAELIDKTASLTKNIMQYIRG
ncbi:hypothetical protein HYV81_01430 [Candidatus Woesearchaeota archaeon]|nr:hypothetical protein [Candidatus Woesearchaeota archaeon]